MCDSKFASASDTLHKPIASIIKNTKLADGQKRLADAFKPVDTNRIIKRTTTFANKNAPKSAQDPAALSFGNFKVSEQLYGSYASYIVEYVKNYNNNHGARMGRIRAANKGYFTMIDNTMRKNGIPKEMHSLAVIESALNPNAVSPVGAMGPWQFMPATGQMLGLQVTELQDDRRDFYKSTIAAAKYTKRLYNMFHDWLLVIAAYNCGPAPVLRNLSKTGGKSFWDIKQYLPKETQNHVMAFIATSVYYDKNTKVLDLGFLPKDAKNISTKDLGTANSKAKPKQKTNAVSAKNTPVQTPEKTENIEGDDLAIDTDDESKAQQILPEEVGLVITLKIKGGYNIEAISTFLDYDLNKLRRWNPKFNEQTSVLGAQVKLTIPSSKLDAFLIQKDKILQSSIKNPITTSGNTIYIQKNASNKPAPAKQEPAKAASALIIPKVAPFIAPKVATTKSTIVLEQKITPKNNLAVTENNMAKASKNNQRVAAQLEQKAAIPNHLLPNKPKVTNPKNYVVKAGDRLTDIATQFGLTLPKLMELNHLKQDTIQVGSTLILE
jgi:soluble lytic murein transglycosylase-like protein/LysM repeat protein